MQLKLAFQKLTSVQLVTVNGGAGGFPADAAGEALRLGAEGTVKALNQSDAPSMQDFHDFNRKYNPFLAVPRALNNYFNPTPGNGAPGDTYVPATANPDGSINRGHFKAPGK